MPWYLSTTWPHMLQLNWCYGHKLVNMEGALKTVAIETCNIRFNGLTSKRSQLWNKIFSLEVCLWLRPIIRVANIWRLPWEMRRCSLTKLKATRFESQEPYKPHKALFWEQSSGCLLHPVKLLLYMNTDRHTQELSNFWKKKKMNS